MDARNAAIAAGEARELVWLLEHPPVYTAGTSAAAAELLDPRFEVVAAGRGGRYTYHGPGQRVGYVLLDLTTAGARRARLRPCAGRLGDRGAGRFRRRELPHARAGSASGPQDIDGREAKIGAIGVRIRRWVTMHGFAVNLAPDLSHFSGIVPCGIGEYRRHQPGAARADG